MCSGRKYLVHRIVDRRRRRTTIKCQVGFPIRTSRDQRVLSPPPGLSQSATSFIASCCQGIHQTPLSRLIRSRRRRALLREPRRDSTHPSLLCPEVEHDPCRAPGGSRHSRAASDACTPNIRPLGQCLQTWKDCSCCPIAPLRGGECPRTAKPRTRHSPHLGRDQKRLVFCSLNDVNCRDHAIGQRRAFSNALSNPIPALRRPGIGGSRRS